MIGSGFRDHLAARIHRFAFLRPSGPKYRQKREQEYPDAEIRDGAIVFASGASYLVNRVTKQWYRVFPVVIDGVRYWRLKSSGALVPVKEARKAS